MRSETHAHVGRGLVQAFEYFVSWQVNIDSRLAAWAAGWDTSCMDELPQQPEMMLSPLRLDERQERIRRRLLLIGPGPAAFFRDACLLMQRQLPLATTSHLVGHLLREVESAIRAVLKGIGGSSKTSSPSQSNHKREIEEVLKALDLGESDPGARAWLQLCERSDGHSLERLAHRDNLVHSHTKTCGFLVRYSDLSMVWMSSHQIMEDRHGYSVQEVHHPLERG